MSSLNSYMHNALFAIILLSVSGALQAKPEEAIRLGIISLSPPAKTYKQWTPFAEYLGRKLGRPVTIVAPRGFKKIKEAVNKKTVDIFYVNSHIYYRLKLEGVAKPLAQMMTLANKVTSNSVMFVRTDSGISSIKDLKGHKVAFVAPMGSGGYLAPRAMFYANGIKTKKQTTEVFTKNLTSSITKVLTRDVMAGTMCGLNYELMSKRVETGDLKIIATSEEYSENVLGIRSDHSNALQNQISSIIIGMATDTEGQKVLSKMSSMKILKFVKYDPSAEKITQKLLKKGNF